MIITIEYNLITRVFYVYRRLSPTKRVAVELRTRRTKAMRDFMEKAMVKKVGNIVTYT